MSKASVRKGKQAERELANRIQSELKEQFGKEVRVRRTLDQTRDGGFDLDGIPFLAIEVKRHETLKINTWWAQTREQAKAQSRIPVLAYRQSRKDWRFILPLSCFDEGMFARHMSGDFDYYGPDFKVEIDVDSFVLVCYDNLIMKERAAEARKEFEKETGEYMQ